MISQVRHIHSDLVARCKKGDRRAQRELYESYATAMFNVAMRILNNREEAEDVLQEAFVDVFTKIHTYREEATIGAWIRRIVLNRALNVVRKKKMNWADLDEERTLVADEEENAERSDKPEPEQVHAAIKQLPEGYRVVLSLYLIEGLSHKQIAEELKITESTSKSQFNRAKARLRKDLMAAAG
ncbi:MAG: sigma-70 family RNA polymerase sigma factor [Flavobacteriales bacterium]|nr:sigma-70 family RNA polymerase sigma factor [Flavobacteriales bacterium]MCB9447905.1 sigma-70 family RNA polymerase sigma factor [Flavobacteriales bacterium]